MVHSFSKNLKHQNISLISPDYIEKNTKPKFLKNVFDMKNLIFFNENSFKWKLRIQISQKTLRELRYHREYELGKITFQFRKETLGKSRFLIHISMNGPLKYLPKIFACGGLSKLFKINNVSLKPFGPNGFFIYIK